MPCYDYEGSPYRESERAVLNQQARLDKITRVACELAGFYRQTKRLLPNVSLSAETEQWMREHDEWDTKRALKTRIGKSWSKPGF